MNNCRVWRRYTVPEPKKKGVIKRLVEGAGPIMLVNGLLGVKDRVVSTFSDKPNVEEKISGLEKKISGLEKKVEEGNTKLQNGIDEVRKFERAMKKIKELNPAAEEWLRNIPLEMWTMSHDGGYRYGQATTNMVETYNGQLRSARHLPITSMVEYIYYRSVKLVAERRTQTLNDLQNGHVYCKNSRELFQKIEQKASAHKIIPYNQERGVFEVTTARYKTDKGFWKGGNKHHIDLSKGYCSCGKWHRGTNSLLFAHMLLGLGNAKNISFDLDSIEYWDHSEDLDNYMRYGLYFTIGAAGVRAGITRCR
ncbi:hypothetical protein POM88_015300 [Heracleum sosnowskyi]|uniref:Uncharacterized protein n=1 Tax=Heracleum sosnowskyi TaxID=360622 RepID=A0AAD8MW62_9APIA|nr:hypothetical protein POM88_015300 [Heracleum sosnowskyi]